MKQLYTQSEFNNAKTNDKLPCECYVCGRVFYKEKRAIVSTLKNVCGHKGKYCSIKCRSIGVYKQIEIKCTNCNTTVLKFPNQIKKYKNHFCSSSCAATYNNKHKVSGNRRSKLEIWIEERLKNLYPHLEILYNKSDAINSELDIYIPSLNIAFELNGIFHYEPIFGINKLQQIQKNDIFKSKLCLENKIDLCTIDVSQQKYFKESTSKKFLDIIISIINERIA
jgi:hypothetical protein